MHQNWENALKPKGIPGPELTLAAGGKSNYVILLPEKPTSQERKAASDLALWLREMTGARFAVVSEGARRAPAKKLISIGGTAALARAGLAEADVDLGEEGYAMAVAGGNLFLLGGRTRGPINAVYALLEEDLGCRWYERNSSTVPHRGELKFRPVPRHVVPVLEIRDPFYWDAFDGTWSLRNRTNSPAAPVAEEYGGHMKYALFVHTFNTLVPPDVYFRDHPEYYSELGGVRRPVQLCLTNPEVLRITIENVKAILRKDPSARLISVSPNDGTGYCECAKCRAIEEAEGSKSGTLIPFCNAVGDAIKDEFPHVKISTLAYLDTAVPPKTARPRDNVAIQLCTDSHAWPEPFLTVEETEKFQSIMRAWEAIGATMDIWDYTVNFSHYSIPMPNMPVVTEDIRFFFAHGAKGVMLQGAYQGAGSENGIMRSWVWAKQLWDPSLDTRALMRDFIYGYYGDAAEPIWQYNDMLWNMWVENHSKPPSEDKLRGLGIRYGPDSAFLSREFLDGAFSLFAQAEGRAQDPETRRRVKLAKLPILYVKVCQAPETVKGIGPDGTDYNRLLDELEQIVKAENVRFFAEGGEDVPGKIARWREQFAEAYPVPRTWRFRRDAEQQGEALGWWRPEFDDGEWAEVSTGSAWFRQLDPDLTGHGWGRVRFIAPQELQGRHVALRFGALDEGGVVYLNGVEVQNTDNLPGHEWDKPFEVDVTGVLRLGEENVLAVHAWAASTLGGVFQPVYMVPEPSKP